MALRCCLGNEDTGRKHGETQDDCRQRRRQCEKNAGDGAYDRPPDPGAQANARDEVSGGWCNDQADEIHKKQRTQRGGGERKRCGAQVESDPRENADQ